MADINQVITLGIGIPADIEHFVLFGLNASQFTGVVDVTLHERYFLDSNLYERKFAEATLQDKP